MSRLPIPVAKRFWSKVKLAEPDQCWLWQGTKVKSGKIQYGYIQDDDKVHRGAHRIAYQLSIGPIPDGLEVCHTCDNGLCCNPQHLWIGTHKQNMEDRNKKNRLLPTVPHGERAGNAKLTEADVLKIRELAATTNLSRRELGRMFNTTNVNITHIVNRHSWTHI